MKSCWYLFVAASLLLYVGCGGGEDATDQDSSDSGSTANSTADSSDHGSTSDESNSRDGDSSDANASASGRTGQDTTEGVANADTENDDAGKGDFGDDNSAGSDSGAAGLASGEGGTNSDESGTTGEDAEDDPLKALAESMGNPQLTAAYSQIRNEAAADGAGPDQLYTEVNLLQTMGMMLLQTERRDEALLAFKASYEAALAAEAKLGTPPEPANELLSNVYYNGACVLSLSGELDEAHAALGRSIEFGFSDAELLKTDTDLDPLRKRDGFDADLAAWVETIETAGQFTFDFDVTDLEGNAQSLTSLQGKVVIVDFWGTWCPPCREEIPSFIRLQNEYGEKGLQIIGLNYERVADAEAPGIIKDFIEENGINYPCAIGTPAIRSQVPDFQGYPTTIFIDRTGTVREMTVGLHPYEALEEKVVALLNETSDSADEESGESESEN